VSFALNQSPYNGKTRPAESAVYPCHTSPLCVSKVSPRNSSSRPISSRSVRYWPSDLCSTSAVSNYKRSRASLNSSHPPQIVIARSVAPMYTISCEVSTVIRWALPRVSHQQLCYQRMRKQKPSVARHRHESYEHEDAVTPVTSSTISPQPLPANADRRAPEKSPESFRISENS